MDNNHLIYLDHAAATPLDPSVLAAMQPYLTSNYFNPSANYTSALTVKKTLDQVRASVAYWLGAKTPEIIFTAGATEANNMAIYGIMEKYPEANMIVSNIEHESVLAPAKEYAHKLAGVKADGRIDLEDLKSKIDDHTVLISMIYASNEIGVIQPIREVGKIVDQERKRRGQNGLPIYLHTDAAQAANHLDLHVSRLGVDLMSLNGSKIYGPKQSGVLYVKTGVNLKPLIKGGGQERNLRSGTENVAGIIGLATALDITQNMREEESRRMQLLSQNFIDRLSKNVPNLVINGSLKYRLPNNVHITIHGIDNERLLMELDQKGILAAAGSACSASSDEPSHVLKAIGKTDAEARSSLRLTLGRDTNEEALEYVEKVLISFIA